MCATTLYLFLCIFLLILLVSPHYWEYSEPIELPEWKVEPNRPHYLEKLLRYIQHYNNHHKGHCIEPKVCLGG